MGNNRGGARSPGTAATTVVGATLPHVEEAIRALAAHLRAYDEPHLAAALEETLVSDSADLPRRVIAQFRHGMGGLMDRDLYRGAARDAAATARRDELAEQLYDAAQRAPQR